MHIIETVQTFPIHVLFFLKKGGTPTLYIGYYTAPNSRPDSKMRNGANLLMKYGILFNYGHTNIVTSGITIYYVCVGTVQMNQYLLELGLSPFQFSRLRRN